MADRLICAVNTAIPTTRPAHSFLKFRACSFNMLFSGFRLFNGDYPADPFITRERCKILPRCKRFRVRSYSFPQIRWNFVHYTAGNNFFSHGVILSKLLWIPQCFRDFRYVGKDLSCSSNQQHYEHTLKERGGRHLIYSGEMTVSQSLYRLTSKA